MATVLPKVKRAPVSARLNPDMATTPKPTPEDNGNHGPSGTEDGMVVLSYILAGLIFYGGLGWAGDYFLKTSWLLPVGLILGLVTSLYLIIKRYGSGT